MTAQPATKETTTTPEKKERFPIKSLVRWGVSLAAVGFIVWMLPIKDRCNAAGVCEDGLLTTLKRANVVLMIPCFGVYLVSTAAWAARWRALLRPAGVELGFFGAWRVTLEAQAGGILLPGGVGGDALRIAYAKEHVPSASVPKIVASIIADRILGLVTLALAALSLGLLFDPGSRDLRVALPMLAGIPLGAAVGWGVLRQLVKGTRLRELRILKSKVGERLIVPMLDYASTPGATPVILQGLVLSALVSAAQFAVVRGLLLTLGATPSGEAWVYVGSAFAMIVAAFPAAPGGWGTAEAAYVFFLGRAGIAAPAAAAVCLLYRLMWYAIGAIGAAIAMTRTGRGEGS